MIDSGVFASHVRDALAHFYEPAHLQTHPLTKMLLGEASRENVGVALRSLLVQAIESLRPVETVAFGGPEWYGYQILCKRYVEGCNQTEICLQMGLSRASVYRYHREALRAVASILWERHVAERVTVPSRPGPASVTEACPAQEEAEEIALTAPRRWVHLDEVLHTAVQTFSGVARQAGINLSVKASDTPIRVCADSAMLHLVMLNILTEAADLASGDLIECSVHESNAEALFSVRIHCESLLPVSQLRSTSGFAMSHRLLEAYSGRLWLDRSGEGILRIWMAMPTRGLRTILIIDDDADTVRLYSRYLSHHAYILHQACRAEAVGQYLVDVQPSLILLDVVMPGQNGWSILQALKTDPASANIPVVICSVLSHPRLAMALGAAAVIQKPVNPEILIRTVESVVAA